MLSVFKEFGISVRPKSSIPPLTGYVGLFVLVLATLLFRSDPFAMGERGTALLVLFCVFFSMVVVEAVQRWRGACVGAYGDIEFSRFNFGALRAGLNRDLLIKFYGLSLIFGFWGLIYRFVPFYQGPMFNFFFDSLLWAAPVLVPLGGVYIWVTHALAVNARDGLWCLGRYCLPWRRGSENVDKSLILSDVLGWAVKGFFLPLMFSFYGDQWHYLASKEDWMAGLSTWDGRYFFNDVYHFIFYVDVILALIGYMATFRLMNTHIRFSETTWSGWLVCIMCYPPFWVLITAFFVREVDSGNWHRQFADYPWLLYPWGYAILGCGIVYSWSTVCFGLRFSNLTHRGIVTHGPYSVMKHPAYVSKNISWWLMEIPFLAVSPWLALKNTVLLLMLNGVYYLRARHEEGMLSRDPLYMTYQAYIRRSSPLRGLFRARKG